MSIDQLNDPLLTLIFGGSLSLIFFVLGILIHKYKWYGLIAGYNHSPGHIKKQYDIEGLAKHVGQGLMTLAVLLIISTALFHFEWYRSFNASMCVFVFIAIIIPLGAPKYMPEQQRLVKEGSADAKHPFLRRILSTSAYKSLEKKTRFWIQVCGKCGHKQDFWEAGGVRGNGVGEPTKLQYCEHCTKLHMHKIRKKTTQELVNA